MLEIRAPHKKTQFAITLFSFLRSDSSNNQNKEEQSEILNGKNESRILKKVVGFLQSWYVEFEWLCYNDSNAMYSTVTQFANTLRVEPIMSCRKIVLTV